MQSDIWVVRHARYQFGANIASVRE